jgi:hypothetical protein
MEMHHAYNGRSSVNHRQHDHAVALHGADGRGGEVVRARRLGCAGHDFGNRPAQKIGIPLGQTGEIPGGEHTRETPVLRHHGETAVVGQAHHRLPHGRAEGEHPAWPEHHVAHPEEQLPPQVASRMERGEVFPAEPLHLQ